MLDSISKLLELQDIDSRISELQEQLNRYPKIWDEMKEQLRKKTEKLEKAKSEESDHSKERRRIEMELRTGAEKLKKFQSQQMMIKSPKELTAIESQIQNLKKQNATNEKIGLELLEKDESVRQKISETQTDLDKLKEKAKTERDRIRKLVNEKQKEITHLKSERQKLVPSLEKSSLKIYTRANNRWPGNAIVEVRNGSCSGCFFALLPNKLIEVHQGDSIVLCDNCGRILSHDESFQPDAMDDDDF